MSSFLDEQKKLEEIRLEAEGLGNRELYSTLRIKVIRISNSWKCVNDGGGLERDDHARLIQIKYDRLDQIDQLQDSA